MRPAERLDAVLLLAQEIADPMGLAVVEVKFGQEGRKRTLEVTIFKVDQPVSLSDCEQLSRLLEASLDRQSTNEAPLIESSYSLVVQSPGIDRVLKTEREFQVFAGQQVQVQTKEKVLDFGVKFTGVLLGAGLDEVKLAHPKPLPTRTAKNAVEPCPAKHDDISIKKSIISEVRLFAADLATKTTKLNH